MCLSSLHPDTSSLWRLRSSHPLLSFSLFFKLSSLYPLHQSSLSFVVFFPHWVHPRLLRHAIISLKRTSSRNEAHQLSVSTLLDLPFLLPLHYHDWFPSIWIIYLGPLFHYLCLRKSSSHYHRNFSCYSFWEFLSVSLVKYDVASFF